jgi:hypothetical protein
LGHDLDPSHEWHISSQEIIALFPFRTRRSWGLEHVGLGEDILSAQILMGEKIGLSKPKSIIWVGCE